MSKTGSLIVGYPFLQNILQDFCLQFSIGFLPIVFYRKIYRIIQKTIEKSIKFYRKLQATQNLQKIRQNSIEFFRKLNKSIKFYRTLQATQNLQKILQNSIEKLQNSIEFYRILQKSIENLVFYRIFCQAQGMLHIRSRPVGLLYNIQYPTLYIATHCRTLIIVIIYFQMSYNWRKTTFAFSIGVHYNVSFISY